MRLLVINVPNSQGVQKRDISSRLILMVSNVTSSNLHVQQLIEYNTALLIWKSKHGLAPTYISDMFVSVKSVHDHDTRNAAFSFHPAEKNLTAGTKSFSHSGCLIWNKLPKDAQASSSLRDFKTRALKFFKDQGQTFNKIAERLGRSGFA